jgi:hypothetical protein
VSTAFARALFRLIDGDIDRRGKRRVCAKTQSGPDKRNAAIVPRRLHGSLLERSDRWRAGTELSEAEPRKSLAGLPNRGESNCPGSAAGSGGERSRESSGSRCACAEYVRANHACTECGRGTANHFSAARRRRRQTKPGAAQKRSAGLRGGLQSSLRGHSAGRLRIDRLPEAQYHDLVGNV